MKSRSVVYLILCLVLGWIVSTELVLVGHKLVIENGTSFLSFFFVMPIVETFMFNFWLQQGFIDYGLHRNIALIRLKMIAMLVSAFAFALAHLALANWWVGAWFIIGLALALLWEITRSFWFVAFVHAYWNICLWWHS